MGSVEKTVFDDGETAENSDGVAEFYSAIGKQIKIFRERAGLTQRQLAERIGYSEDMVGAIERGTRTPRVEFLTAVDELLGAGGILKAVADDVMRAKIRVSTRHPAFSKAFTYEEARAIEIHDYSTMVIPGLLQTEAYIRALYEMRRPLLSGEQIDEWVEARLARQEILAKWPLPVISWVIDESVLRRPLGGWDVQKEQLEHLLKVGQMRGPELQIMPLARMSHAGMGGSFILLTPNGSPPIGYVAAQHVNRLITDPVEVRNMAARYSSIRAQALSLSESLALIEQILGER
ncbi:helix-turn-helix transcriptional regulator [Kitasatospora aureofaciens]|uniref:helix-turn-helix domain-containing protein n=1 Tax=Kitasatospora aureofaciens TaxID=1894 RepID=UPI001C47FEFC|nr:helix-turn-helix transcriptional regulator [Kitasatospora aureofaciens]MBV6696805.1 helix-turn-helix transcriptional regulator [Kitasatospora aureofaciens]